MTRMNPDYLTQRIQIQAAMLPGHQAEAPPQCSSCLRAYGREAPVPAGDLNNHCLLAGSKVNRR